jgi:LPXTG-motif cell wall-anchored protein
MKVRKILALVLAFALTAALSVPAFAANGDLVADLANDVDFFAGGGDGTDEFMKAGGPEFVKKDGGLLVTNRTANWNALDVYCTGFMEAGKSYTVVVVMGGQNGPVPVQLGQTDSPYGTLVGPETVNAGERVTLTYKVMDGSEFSPSLRGIRMMTEDGNTDDYIIYSAKVYEGNPPAAGATTTAAPAGDGGGGGNPSTADTSIILFAGMALLMAGALGFVFYRKAKAQ